MKRLHLIAILENCSKNSEVFTNVDEINNCTQDLIKSVEKESPDIFFHQFTKSSNNLNLDISGVLKFKDFRISIHTSTKKNKSLVIDFFSDINSYHNDNYAENFINLFVSFFEPKKTTFQKINQSFTYTNFSPEINFGKEWLNKNSSYSYNLGKLIYKEKSKYQLLEIFNSPEFGKLLRIDGDYMTSEADEFFYHETLVHPAVVAHGNVKKVLILGGGDGGSAKEILKHPKIQKIIIAELDEDVIKISKKFLKKIHGNSFYDPRVNINICNGFNFVNETSEKFDLVLMDLTDPDTPAFPLYTLNFFKSVEKILTSRGSIVLHTGSPIFSPNTVKSIYKNLKKIFPIVAPMGLYIPLYGTYWSLAVCSNKLDPRVINKNKINEALKNFDIKKLKYYNSLTHFGLFALPNYFQKLISK